MKNPLEKLSATVVLGIILAIILLLVSGVGSFDQLWWAGFFRYLHVIAGVMWIGLLYYFNFVQMPTMPKIPNELKPGVSKHIAPAALFWFRWAAAATVLFGLITAWLSGYLPALWQIGASPRFTMIGLGMWMALIMAFNVWFVIWPNQQRALGLVEADADSKAKSARTAMLFSRFNTFFSIGMLLAMVMSKVFG